jgi:hypothetical protein
VATVKSDRLIFRLWRGDDRLWRAFWLIWILGGFLVGLATMVLIKAGLFSLFAAFLTRAAFLLYAGVTVWRNAFNCGAPIWGWIARILVGVAAVYLVLSAADVLSLP